MTGAVFCAGTSAFGAIEADALPARDNAPASPNTVTAVFFRPLALIACFKRDISDLHRCGPALGPRVFNQLSLPEGKLLAATPAAQYGEGLTDLVR